MFKVYGWLEADGGVFCSVSVISWGQIRTEWISDGCDSEPDPDMNSGDVYGVRGNALLT